MSERAFRRTLGLVAVAGVLLRLAYIRVVRPALPEFGDAETYRLLAGLLADGEGYIRPREFLLTGERIATAEFPPLWPMALAALDLIGLDGPNEQRALGALIGGLTVVVVGLLAAALVDRRVGVVAAELAAVHPQLIVLDTSLLSEGLAILLVAAALLGVARARRDPDGPLADSGRRWWLLASVAFGLAALTRSEVVLLALIVVPVAARHRDRREWVRVAAVGLAGLVVCVGGWTVRTAVSLGEPQPLTNNSGTLIAGSNCDAVYAGSQIGLWRFDCVLAVDTEGLDESEASRERRAAGVEYALDHVTELPVVGTIRVLRTFGAWDIRSQLFYESFEGRNYHWMWAGWFGWLASVAAAVVAVVATRRGSGVRRDLWLLLVPIGVVAFTALASYGNQRFRAVAEPGMVVLAATGVVVVIDRVRRHRQGAQAPDGSS